MSQFSQTVLVENPALPRVLKRHSRRLPELGRKIFFPIEVDPLNLESQNQDKNIPMVLPSSPIKIDANLHPVVYLNLCKHKH